jgi:serine/threonine-protein kinase
MVPMPAADKQIPRVEIARRKPRSSSAPTSPGATTELPPDLINRSAKRIGFLGLVCAVTAPAAYLAELYLQPVRVLAPDVPFPQITAIGLFVLGLALFVVSWSGKVRPSLVIDLGLIFEVLVGLAISLSEYADGWPEDPVRSVSWNCLWITVFVMAVPATFGKMALAAVATALMAPLGLLVAAQINKNALPSQNQLILILGPIFAAPAWAIPVARYVHGLERQVDKARELGSYRLVELLGRGGMGEVWRAEHRLLARPSALKLIRPEVLGDADDRRAALLVQRFEREARATAALHSPHTVQLYDFGTTEDGNFFYAMELLEGIDFEKLVERFGPQQPGRVVSLLIQICDSLAEAHHSGLIHRDIKPRNVFVCRLGLNYDFVKVLDFGLVKSFARTGDSWLTAEAAIVGTPAFMAPEMATGRALVDGRADIYSVGCVAYWLITGKEVFEADTVMALMLAHAERAPVPPSAVPGVHIPASLESIVLSCLEKDPARRPQSVRELAGRLAAGDCGQLWTPADAERWWAANITGPEQELRAGAETL